MGRLYLFFIKNGLRECRCDCELGKEDEQYFFQSNGLENETATTGWPGVAVWFWSVMFFNSLALALAIARAAWLSMLTFPFAFISGIHNPGNEIGSDQADDDAFHKNIERGRERREIIR